MAVHAGADLAEQLEPLGQPVLRRLGAWQPLEKDRLPGHRPDLDIDHLPPVGGAVHGRGQQALVPAQGLEPGEFRFDRARRVVSGPVHPQHRGPPGDAIVDQVGRVLRQAEQRDVGPGLESEWLERGPGERIVVAQDGFLGVVRGNHWSRPSIPASSRSISSRARVTPAVVPAMYSRPDAPIMVTSTRVFSGAACSAPLAATAANSAGVISQTSSDWPGSSMDACRDRLMITACWSVTSSMMSLYRSSGLSWSAAVRPMPSRMAWPARCTAAALGECTSSTPNCRSMNRIPGSTDGSARSARSVTRSMARPGATSTIRA